MTMRLIQQAREDGAQQPILPIPLPSLSNSECTVEAAWVGDTVVVEIQGSVDARNAEEFGERIQLLRSQLGGGGGGGRVAAARVDLQDLSFLNSWGLKAFVSWVTEAPEEAYPIVLVLNPNAPWQRRSFQNIAALGSGRVVLEA